MGECIHGSPHLGGWSAAGVTGSAGSRVTFDLNQTLEFFDFFFYLNQGNKINKIRFCNKS